MKQEPPHPSPPGTSLRISPLPLEMISEAARAYDVPLEVVLLLQSSMIAGVGGTDQYRISYATCPVVLPAEGQAAARLIDRLSADLRFTHRMLSSKRRYIKARRPLEEFEAKSSPMQLSYLAQAAKPEESPHDDSLLHLESADSLTIPTAELRLEAILRPGFLVENLAPAELIRVLARCHRCEGFYPGTAPFVLPQKEMKRHAWADGLCELLDGTTLQGVDNLDPDGTNETLVGRLQMIMRLGQDGRRWLVTQHPGLLTRSLLVPSSSPAPLAGNPINPHHLEAYWNAFGDASRKALARRRAGLLPFDAKMEGVDRELRFLELYRPYAHFIGADAILAGCAPLARLPEFLAMGLQAIAGKQAVEGLAETAFDGARRLAEAHRAEVLSHLHSEHLEDFRTLATKVIAVVSKKQPVTLRTLVRSFDQQRVEIYTPVIAMLLEHHALAGDLQGLRLGSRRLGELNLHTLVMARLAEGS